MIMKQELNQTARLLDAAILVFLAAAGFVLVRVSPVRSSNGYATSDPRGILLVSQSILDHGTVCLDAYGTFAQLQRQYRGRAFEHDGHIYNLYPSGTPLLATPAVLVARHAGKNMQDTADDTWLQGWIVAFILSAICAIMYRICRLRLGMAPSLALTVLFVFGTSLASTCGVALWSFDFETLLILLSLYIVLRVEDRVSTPSTASAIVLGTLLVGTFLCRPSAGVFSALIVLFLFARNRAFAFRVALAAGLGALAFMLWSFHEYGLPLPPYYLIPLRADSRPSHFWVGLYGNLLSPGRGWLIFSPFFVPILLTGLWRARRTNPLLLMAFAWMIVELVFVARYPCWWAGWCYGARYLTDVVPAVLVVCLATVRDLPPRCRRVYWVAVAILGAFSLYVHVIQGMFNPATRDWNRVPNIDENPHLALDWQYPQFLASPEQIRRRQAEIEGRE
jgi:hypothetical protein